MKTKGKALLFMARAGMELSWLYAWAAFVTTAIMPRSFPLPQAVGVYFLSIVCIRTRAVRTRGWRFIATLFFQAAGFSLAAAAVFYAFANGPKAFFDGRWLGVFLTRPRPPQEWFAVGIIAGFVLLFWIGGITLTLRPNSHASVVRRFNFGVTALFLLFLIKLMVLYRGGVRIGAPFCDLFIFPFFLFGLFSLALVGDGPHEEKAFLPGFQGAGLILAFALVSLGFAAAAVAFFLPYMTHAAEAGYLALKTAAAPLAPVLIALLRFLFAPRRLRDDPRPHGSGAAGIQIGKVGAGTGEAGFLQHLLAWSVFGIVILLVTAALTVGVWLLVRRLWLRYKQMPEYEARPDALPALLRRLWSAVRAFFQRRTTGIRLFAAMAGWGRRGGVPYKIGETPFEYGLRLSRRFPLLHREIDAMVEAYHREVYAGRGLDSHHIKAVRRAWRRMRNPRHWPVRLKSALFGNPPDPSEKAFK